MKSTVFRVFEDLKFKISEEYKQNWSFPVSSLFGLEVGGPQAKQGRDWKTSIFIVVDISMVNLESKLNSTNQEGR